MTTNVRGDLCRQTVVTVGLLCTHTGLCMAVLEMSELKFRLQLYADRCSMLLFAFCFICLCACFISQSFMVVESQAQNYFFIPIIFIPYSVNYIHVPYKQQTVATSSYTHGHRLQKLVNMYVIMSLNSVLKVCEHFKMNVKSIKSEFE